MRKLGKENSVTKMAMSVFFLLIILAVQAAVAVEERRRIRTGDDFCGLNEPNSRTYNLPLFIPLIKATIEPSTAAIAAETDHFWFCQRPFGRNTLGDSPQFMTLYSKTNKLPVYSIYKQDVTWTKDGKRATALPRLDGRFETAAQTSNLGFHTELATDSSFLNSGFDRGHLFADNYASDQAQQKATYRITNSVAQDPDFNKKQWSKAESWLMKEGMFKCKHPRGMTPVGTPYTLTGAVTGRKWNENGEPGFQGGAPYRIKYGQNEEMQVPTHMWTTMLCDIGNGDIHHMSFIGSNYQGGEVVFYRSFQAFTADLNAMYGGVLGTSNMFPNLHSQPVDGVYNLPPGVCGGNQVLVCTLLDNTGPIFQTWNEVLVPQARADLLIERLMSSLEVSGHSADYIFGKLKDLLGLSAYQMIKLAMDKCNPWSDICDTDDYIQFVTLQAQQSAGSRRKRELSNRAQTPSTTNTTAPTQTTSETPTTTSSKTSPTTHFMIFEVIDKDPARDFRLSECTLTEVDTNTTLAIDRHTIDMEEMKHYEETTDGSSVDVASMMPDGSGTRMPKSVRKDTTINIVLKPRWTP